MKKTAPPLVICLITASALLADTPLEKALSLPLEIRPQPAAAVEEPHFIIINPGLSDDGYASQWDALSLIESGAIYEWGRTHGMYMRLDAPPVIDNIAGYLPPGGSLVLDINGLKRGAYYTMHVDFVTFRNPDEISFPSLLKVFAKNEYHQYQELAAFSLDNQHPARIPIPFELSESGKITVLFEEYSLSKTSFKFETVWGIWDIIITDADDLSGLDLEKQARPPKIPYKTDILR